MTFCIPRLVGFVFHFVDRVGRTSGVMSKNNQYRAVVVWDRAQRVMNARVEMVYRGELSHSILEIERSTWHNNCVSDLNDVARLGTAYVDGSRHHVGPTADWLGHSLVECGLVGVPLPHRLHPRVALAGEKRDEIDGCENE